MSLYADDILFLQNPESLLQSTIQLIKYLSSISDYSINWQPIILPLSNNSVNMSTYALSIPLWTIQIIWVLTYVPPRCLYFILNLKLLMINILKWINLLLSIVSLLLLKQKFCKDYLPFLNDYLFTYYFLVQVARVHYYKILLK